MEKWWFRLLIVVFICVVLLSIPFAWVQGVEAVYFECIDSYQDVPGAMRFVNCNENARNVWFYPGVIGPAILSPVFLFYIVQLIFFKVVVDFIVLGNK